VPVRWHVASSYFEACNCDAICPCRTVNGQVRRASISLSHEPRRWQIRAARYVTVSAVTPVNDETTTVSCGIPGDDHPGQEVVSDELMVNDAPLSWDLRARCGSATDFSYRSAA